MIQAKFLVQDSYRLTTIVNFYTFHLFFFDEKVCREKFHLVAKSVVSITRRFMKPTIFNSGNMYHLKCDVNYDEKSLCLNKLEQ